MVSTAAILWWSFMGQEEITDGRKRPGKQRPVPARVRVQRRQSERSAQPACGWTVRPAISRLVVRENDCYSKFKGHSSQDCGLCGHWGLNVRRGPNCHQTLCVLDEERKKVPFYKYIWTRPSLPFTVGESDIFGIAARTSRLNSEAWSSEIVNFTWYL